MSILIIGRNPPSPEYLGVESCKELEIRGMSAQAGPIFAASDLRKLLNILLSYPRKRELHVQTD